MKPRKAKLSPYEKLEKSVGESFAEEMRSAQDEKVKDTLVNLTQEIEQQKGLKKDDQKLIELKAQKDALSGGYNDIIKFNKTKIKYLLTVLESRGKL